MTTTASRQTEAFAFAGAPLPDGAENVHVGGENGLDQLVLLRFDAPVAAADAWVAKVAGAPAVDGTDPALGYLGEGTDWWLPDFPQGAAGVQAERGTRSVRIVTLAAGPNRKRVWAAIFSH